MKGPPRKITDAQLAVARQRREIAQAHRVKVIAADLGVNANTLANALMRDRHERHRQN